MLAASLLVLGRHLALHYEVGNRVGGNLESSSVAYVHHLETFHDVAFEHGSLGYLEDAVGITGVGEQCVAIHRQNQLAHQHIAGLRLGTLGILSLETVQKTVFGLFEIVRVTSRHKGGHCQCQSGKQ